jgi:C_GCAxxG_C_C family probable redox protein
VTREDANRRPVPGTPDEVVAELVREDPEGDPWRRPERVAVALFEAGFSCSEAAAFTLATCFGAGIENAQRLGTALGGGIARAGLVCGCLSGVAVALGALAGRTSCLDEEARERAYEVVSKVASRIEEKVGSVSCRTLTGLDFGLQADRDEFHRRIQGEVCTPVLSLAVRVAVEELERAGFTAGGGTRDAGER